MENQFVNNGNRITLKISRVGQPSFEIVPDFIVEVNGKYRIIDAKFSKKSGDNFSVQRSLTKNQRLFRKWFEDGLPFEIEVRANEQKLRDLPGLSTGSVIQIEAFDILKSGVDDISSGNLIPGF